LGEEDEEAMGLNISEGAFANKSSRSVEEINKGSMSTLKQTLDRLERIHHSLERNRLLGTYLAI
jgi:hypothetical protein